MKCIINRVENPSFNLAFEEEFLLSEYLTDEAAFCIWRNHKSVIIGVSQSAEQEVNLRFCYDNDIPVIRRKTGGGTVYHDLGNLNFSLFFPFRPAAANHYEHAYAILKPAFNELGLDISLSRTNDLLFDGRKFSGMAQRIAGDRMMVHGTILFDTDLGVMSKVLSVDNSKFLQPRGVASRHASVVNIREYLKDIPDALTLALRLRSSLQASSSCIPLSIDFLDRVKNRAESDYAPLNFKNRYENI